MDSRTGSAELAKYFTPYGIQPSLVHLDYGDFDFLGNGPKGQCAVVFERKRIEDLVQSMESGRLSGHQLPGMAQQYDYGYLIIEGSWRAGPDGQLEVNTRGHWHGSKMHTRAITNYIMGLALRAGLLPWKTFDQVETVRFVVDQYRMWNEKEWLEHKSHDVVYAPATPTSGFHLMTNYRKVSLAEKVAMQLPGLQDKARYAAERFGTVKTVATANVEDWAGLVWRTRKGQPRKLGLLTAKKIVAAIEGKE